jgi:signal transduction histidine kinase/CheY-like chemotaxis protein
VLALSGQFLDVGRAYVFQFRKYDYTLLNTHEWCASGVASKLAPQGEIAVGESMSALTKLLTQDGLVAPYHISELSSDIQSMWESRRVQTLLLVPLYLGGRLQGFLGFDEIRHARHWLPEEIATLRTIAQNYGRLLEQDESRRSLIQAHEEALHSIKLKSAFIATMSHEIRTPMTGVIGMLELLRETLLDDTQRDFAENAYISAQSQLKILTDLLDFSKLDTGKAELAAEPLDIRTTIKDLIAIQSPNAVKKNLSLSVTIADTVPEQVVGDRARLDQLLSNLISNAIKFTHHGGIRVAVNQLGAAQGLSRIHFEVADTGIGIPSNQLDHIFESFVQIDNSTTREYGGTGLGLAICKQLVELMGGEIDVKSTVGTGSTFGFTLTLPIADARLSVGQATQSLPKATISPDDKFETEFPTGHVLLVDDEPANQRLVEWVLNREGVTVSVADDGEEALRLITANPYDLILMDVQMPGMDGITAVRQIRALPTNGNRTPIVMWTGNTAIEDQQACLTAGANEVLVKPLTLNNLRDCIQKWLALKT